MARYFFNIYDGEEFFDIGIELDSARDIPGHMFKIAQAWMEEEGNRKTNWHLEARDERDNKVLEVRLGPLNDES